MSPASGGHVRANGIRQHYLHFPGEGRPVVIVPGIVSPAVLWTHVAERLAPRFDCHVLDVRGRGLSEFGPHLDYGVGACAQDLMAFVEALGLTPEPIVIGHSMGARIALRAAALAAGRLHSLVLLDPPTSGPGRRPYPVPLARTLALLRAAQRGEAAAALRASTATPWPEALQQLRAEWLSTCDERAVFVASEDFHGQDMFADLARSDLPITLICAGEGGVVADADVDDMRSRRPDLHAVRLEGVGHQMQAESPEAFCRLLSETLERHDRS